MVVIFITLVRLSILLDKPVWRQRAEDITNAIGDLAIKYPTSFGIWLNLIYETVNGTSEIAVIGKDHQNFLGQIQKIFIPHKIVMTSSAPNEEFPLLAGKKSEGETHIFLCRNYACQKPVSTLNELLSLISTK